MFSHITSQKTTEKENVQPKCEGGKSYEKERHEK